MGGGGTHYDRDVSDQSSRTRGGSSRQANEQMSRSRVDRMVLPKDRYLTCLARSPLVYLFDVTGSMGELPKIIFDKMPMMAGQLAERNYLDDPMISIAAVGDVVGDEAPLQMSDFVLIRDLDNWLRRLWLEGGGGGNARESYETAVYFYATRVEIPNAVTPVCLITGDEGFYNRMTKADLERYLGGEQRDVLAQEAFEMLKKNFKDNVFLLHKRYNGGGDEEIVRQWQTVLGRENVIRFDDNLAVADLTLGIFALLSGRALDEYAIDMEARKQTPERIASVRASLEEFAGSLASAKLASPAPSRIPIIGGVAPTTKKPPSKGKKLGGL